MADVYINDEPVNPKPSTKQTGTRSCHGSIALCLGILCAFLLVVLIRLGVSYRDSSAELSSVSEQRDLLNASLSERTEELSRLQSVPKKICPAGWTLFGCGCYFVSNGSGSWENGNVDCGDRTANLAIIDSVEEQVFLSNLVNNYTWIGLIGGENGGLWRWVSGSILTHSYWKKGKPDPGFIRAEMCVAIDPYGDPAASWNPRLCDFPLQWICEKMA